MNFYVFVLNIPVLVTLDLNHMLTTPSLDRWICHLGDALVLEGPRIRRPWMLNQTKLPLQNPEGGAMVD